MSALDDDALAALGHLNYVEFSRELTRQGGAAGVLREEGGLLLHASPSPFPVMFNGVWRLDPRVPGADVITRADSFFGTIDRGYSIAVRDDVAEDADLVVAAEAASLVAVLHSPEMVCRHRLDDRPLPPRTTLQWVNDHRTFADFVAVSDQAYSSVGLPVGTVTAAITDAEQVMVPHVHAVVAYLDDQAVAAAQVMLSHSIAGVYWVGTTEAARGSGLGEAVTRAVTNRAFADGARAVTLQASPMGAPIYLRMGYEEIYDYSTFVRFEPIAAPSK